MRRNFLGTRPNTFPVTSPGQARAALAYRRYDPQPEKLKQRVLAYSKKRGWLVDGVIKQKPKKKL